MSHLKEQISALIDGELTGAELDRANAHLAACARCRAEAAGLRQLKRELRALAASAPFDMTAETSRERPADATPNWWAAQGHGQGAVTADEALTRRVLAMAQRHAGRPSRAPRRRARYVIWSAVSLVIVGIGAAAFSMGGGSAAAPGPKITPQLEMQMFSLEHAINSGDVPFPDPTQAPTARP